MATRPEDAVHPQYVANSPRRTTLNRLRKARASGATIEYADFGPDHGGERRAHAILRSDIGSMPPAIRRKIVNRIRQSRGLKPLPPDFDTSQLSKPEYLERLLAQNQAEMLLEGSNA
jgi:hypothetical protein